MPGFFEKLAARTLGREMRLAKPIVPSLFANGGLIEPAAVPVNAEQRPHTAEQRSVQPREDNYSSAPQGDRPVEPIGTPENARENIRHNTDRRPMSLQETVNAIFTQPGIRPVLVPVAPVPAATSPVISSLETTPQFNARSTPLAPRVSVTMPQQTPSIRVTIGRVEVKAEFPAAPAPAAPRSTRPPALTLDEYRRQRDRGLR